jgi:hypothetical protein
MHDTTIGESQDLTLAGSATLRTRPLAERVMSALNGNRLTLRQYVGLLGQLYHFSAAAQRHLRQVITRIDDPALASWFVQHAREENGHHFWAEQDLSDLGEEVPLPLPATLGLNRRIGEVAEGPKPYLVLGISRVAENLSPLLDPEMILPEGMNGASRYVRRHAMLDRMHAAEVNRQVSQLTPERRLEVMEESRRFESLMFEFFLAAAGITED